MRSIYARAILAVLFGLGIHTTKTLQAQEQLLAPGDSVLISFYHTDPAYVAYSGVFGIRPDGSIGSPVYSSLRVAGLPLADVERQVRDHLAVNVQSDPRVIVDPLFRVSVAGEVRQPGVYSLGARSTVTEAVLRAGGANERGDLGRVVLYRDGRTIGLDLTRPEPTMGGMQIQSGDQLVVRPRRDIFRNYVLPVVTMAGATAAIINAIQRR